MPKLHVPHLRERLTLAKPWTFRLHPEYRNGDAWELWLPGVPSKVQGQLYPHGRWHMYHDASPQEVTLPAGTVLSVERLYVRQGQAAFDSVTFRAFEAGRKKGTRFWVKLACANKLEFEEADDAA